jgi:hypothetical protein
VEPARGPRLSQGRQRAALASLLGIACVVYLSGVRRELPFYYEGDERVLVQLAVRMAESEDPNPHWFGNPGSTVLYPLALLYRLSDVAWNGAPLLGPDRPLLERFRSDPGPFYLAGRCLNVAYALGSLPLLWLIGRRAFSESSALGGVLLAMLCPLTLTHAQMVRTDASGLFFAMLALWTCLRVLEDPSARRFIVAGVAIGLAVASRYFLAALLAPLLGTSLALLQRARREHRVASAVLRMLAGFAAVPVAFAAASPYFLLDLETALSSLRGEARTSHPGADGLSPVGNLIFYAGDVIPGQLSLTAAILAALGLGIAIIRGGTGRRIVALFVVAFLLGIGVSPLHWPRWIIPILPLLAVFAAAALETLLARALAKPRLRPLTGRAVAIGLLALAVLPGLRMGKEALRGFRPTTRLLARAWLVEHLPAGAKIVVERGTAPLFARQHMLEERLDGEPRGSLQLALPEGHDIEVLLVRSLAEAGSLEGYLGAGYRYAVAGLSVPLQDLKQQEASFYQELFAKARELVRFEPEQTRAGPTIRVFELSATGAAPPR